MFPPRSIARRPRPAQHIAESGPSAAAFQKNERPAGHRDDGPTVRRHHNVPSSGNEGTHVLRVEEFPSDILEGDHAREATSDTGVAIFHLLLPRVKRLVVHAVRGDKIEPQRAACFGVYLLDDEENEHPLLYFEHAANATYAALRIAQVYRLGVAFGHFGEPKTCCQPPLIAQGQPPTDTKWMHVTSMSRKGLSS